MGWIYDSNNNNTPIENVKVTVISTGQYQLTNSDGRYILLDIGVNGTYYFLAEKEDFISQTKSRYYLTDKAQRLNFYFVPNLTDFLNKIIQIINYLCEMFINIASIFMHPPLIIFIGISCFVFLLKRIKK